MRIRVLKNTLGWNDPGWALLLISVSALLSENYLRPLLALVPPCAFHAVTGLPCPSCGSTRAGLALAGGEVFMAFRLQPLFVLACLIAGLVGLHALLAMTTGKRLLVELAPRERRILRPALIVLILLNWLYLAIASI